MTDTRDGVRHSKPQEPDIATDPQEKAELEARNALRQFDCAMSIIDEGLDRGNFKLRPSLILALHREALDGISASAGVYRPAGINIGGSEHQPVGAHLVAAKVEDTCEYVNENWHQKSAIHLSAYVMWYLNWVHPFTDGNGRTSRILSYVILSLKTKMKLPGTNTIPEQIAADKHPYYKALEEADRKYKDGEVDLSEMENLIDKMLASQLLSIHAIARDPEQSGENKKQKMLH